MAHEALVGERLQRRAQRVAADAQRLPELDLAQLHPRPELAVENPRADGRGGGVDQ